MPFLAGVKCLSFHATFSDRFLEWPNITQHFRLFLIVNALYTQIYEAFSTEVCSRLHLSSKRERLDLSAHIRWIQEKAIIHYHTASASKEGDAQRKREKRGVEAVSREEKTPLQIMRFKNTSRTIWFVRMFPIFKNTLFSSLSTNEKCASLCAKVIHLGSCQRLVLLISLFSWETQSASWLSFDFTEMRFSPTGWQHFQCLSSKNNAFKS